LAESFVVSQQADKALAAFSNAVETFPTNPLVFNNRGLFLQQQKRFNEAVADFNKALQIDPKFAVAYTNRGFTQQAAANLTAAEADYSEAIKLAPTNGVFLSLRGTCRLAQGNVNGALEDYNQVNRLDPKNPVAFADIGFAKYFAKDFAGAQAAFDQAVALDGNMRYLNPWRSWILIQLNQPDAATPIVEASSKKLDKERDWIDQMVLFLNGKISEQDLVNVVSKVTDANLKNAQLCEAYYFIAERRSQAGDKTNAAAFYAEVLKTKANQLSAYRGAQFAQGSFGAR
jgi:lipoprotein NlpI